MANIPVKALVDKLLTSDETASGDIQAHKTALTNLGAVVTGGAATGLNMSTARILGRTTASAGAVEEITVGSGLILTNGSLTATGTVALPSARIFVGNGSNVATAVAMSGDIAITNTGATSIAANAVTTAKIANGAVTLEKITGLGTAATAESSSFAPRHVFPGTTRTLLESFENAAPKFVVTMGDSLSTNITLPPAWADAGQFGTGYFNTSGTTTPVVSDTWITGRYLSHPVGSTSQFHPTGGIDAAFMASKFAVAYMADSGIGTFDIEASSVQVSSGNWTKLGATQSTENAGGLIGKYQVFDVPTTSNGPQYKFRITNITGKPVKMVVWGYYSGGQGGVVSVRGMANMTGRDVEQWSQCPDAVFDPIWTGIAPDIIVSRWADGGANWDVGGGFDVQYNRIKALKPKVDFIQLSMGPVYAGPLPLGPQQTWPSYYPGQSNYRINDLVRSQVDSTGFWGWYVCTVAHTQDADKKPGQGASWASYWSELVYDPAIIASGEASVAEQVSKQADWARRNTETFIDTVSVYGKDYATSFKHGLTWDFIHPTTAGWEAVNAYYHNVLPIARSPKLGPYSTLGPIAFQISGGANTPRLNRSLRIGSGATPSLLVEATDAGTDNSKIMGFGMTADVGTISVTGQPMLKLFRSSIGQHSVRPGQTLNITLGDSANVWRALYLDKTITDISTTAPQTISKPCGSVNFAAAAASLVVTNTFAVASTSGTTGSIITATVRTDDATMKSVVVVCAANGSFTLIPNAAPTGVVRVDFAIITP